MKNLKNLLFLSFLVFLNQAKAQENDSYINNSSYVNFDCSFSSFSIKTMPDYFRNIPAYKDDGGDPTGLINRSQFGFLVVGSLNIGAQFNLSNNCAFRFGFVFGASGDAEERNYTNAPGTDQRGYGATLTFSGISIQGPLTLLGLKPFIPFLFSTPKISFDFPANKKNYYPRISIDASYELLTAVNGWDRYNSNECNDFKTLAHVIPLGVSYKIGIENSDNFSSFENSDNFSSVGIGLKYFLNFQTNYGKEFGTNIFPVAIFLNIGI